MKKKIQGLRSASAWMIAATAVLNLSAVVYNRFMSQGLGDDYARLRALMGLAGTLGALSAGLSTYLAKRFSQDAAAGGEAAVGARLFGLSRPGLKTLGWVCLAALAAAPLAASYLHLPSYAEYAFVIVLFGAGVLLLVLRSALQGLHRFFELGLSHMAEGLGRAFLGFALAGWGVMGGLSAMAGAQALSAGAMVYGLWGLKPSKKAPKAEGRAAGEVLGDTASLLLLTLLFYLDEFVAKHYWSDAEASSYSRAALVAKAFLYLATALNMVILPAVARAKHAGEDTRGLLLRFLGGAALLNGIGLAALWWQAPRIISLLTGLEPRACEGLAPFVKVFSVTVVIQAMFQLIVIYLLALKSKAVLRVLGIMVALQAALLTLRHAGPREILQGVNITACMGLASLMGAALRPQNTKKR